MQAADGGRHLGCGHWPCLPPVRSAKYHAVEAVGANGSGQPPFWATCRSPALSLAPAPNRCTTSSPRLSPARMPSRTRRPEPHGIAVTADSADRAGTPPFSRRWGRPTPAGAPWRGCRHTQIETNSGPLPFPSRTARSPRAARRHGPRSRARVLSVQQHARIYARSRSPVRSSVPRRGRTQRTRPRQVGRSRPGSARGFGPASTIPFSSYCESWLTLLAEGHEA